MEKKIERGHKSDGECEEKWRSRGRTMGRRSGGEDVEGKGEAAAMKGRSEDPTRMPVCSPLRTIEFNLTTASSKDNSHSITRQSTNSHNRILKTCLKHNILNGLTLRTSLYKNSTQEKKGQDNAAVSGPKHN